MTRKAILALLAFCLLTGGGCSSLPNFSRIQHNMDTMVSYMGVMASCMPVMVNSTQRMADNADRMTARAEGMLSSLQGNGKAMERTAQNYLQAFIDNDRAVVKNLRGIRDELVELKSTLASENPGKTDGRSSRSPSFSPKMEARLMKLEERLDAISARLSQLRDQRETVPPRAAIPAPQAPSYR